MSILFSGDFHAGSYGEISSITKESLVRKYGREKYNGIKYHVILGDGAFMWPGYHKIDLSNYETLAQRPFPVLCVLGNHEPVYGMKAVPEADIGIGEKVMLVNNEKPFVAYLKRGKIYTIDGFKFLVLGGALSADKKYQKKNKTWWKEEYWSKSEKRDLFGMLERDHSFDGVLSHTGPESMNKMIIRFLFADRHTKIIRDEVAILNDRVDQMIQCPRWWSAHWHHDEIFQNIEMKRKYQYLYRSTKILDRVDGEVVVFGEYGNMRSS
jgi:hypothetical protein